MRPEERLPFVMNPLQGGLLRRAVRGSNARQYLAETDTFVAETHSPKA